MKGPTATRNEQPAEPTQTAVTVRLEDGGALVAEWHVQGPAAEFRRALLRGLSAAAVELNDRHTRGLEREQVAGEPHTVKLMLLYGGPEGELLGEWKISGGGPRFHKRVDWAVSLAVIGVNAERVEILRVGPDGQEPGGKLGATRARPPKQGVEA